MRISDEIDALEVMGIDSLVYLVLDAAARPPGWCCRSCTSLAVGVGFLGVYLAVVQQIGQVSAGGYFLLFWKFQNPADPLLGDQGHGDGDRSSCWSGCYYGYTARGGPVGRRARRPRRRWSLNIIGVHLDREWWGRRSSGARTRASRSAASAVTERFAPPAPRTSPDERAARRTLLQQVRRLEEESAGLFASAWPRKGLDLRPCRPSRLGGPRLLTLGELETLRDDLIEHLRLGRGAPRRAGHRRGAEPPADRGDAPRSGQSSVGARVQRGHRRAGLPSLARAPRAGLLGMLMRWWRVVVSSGCP